MYGCCTSVCSFLACFLPFLLSSLLRGSPLLRCCTFLHCSTLVFCDTLLRVLPPSPLRPRLILRRRLPYVHAFLRPRLPYLHVFPYRVFFTPSSSWVGALRLAFPFLFVFSLLLLYSSWCPFIRLAAAAFFLRDASPSIHGSCRPCHPLLPSMTSIPSFIRCESPFPRITVNSVRRSLLLPYIATLSPLPPPPSRVASLFLLVSFAAFVSSHFLPRHLTSFHFTSLLLFSSRSLSRSLSLSFSLPPTSQLTPPSHRTSNPSSSNRSKTRASSARSTTRCSAARPCSSSARPTSPSPTSRGICRIYALNC